MPEKEAGIGRRPGKKTKLVVGTTLALSAMAMGAEGVLGSHGDKASAISRSVIGTDNTVRLEGLYFRVKDRKNRLEYRVFGDNTKPFGQIEEDTVIPIQPVLAVPIETPEDISVLPNAEPPKPAPLILPEINLILPNPKTGEGEGVWSIQDLPRTSPENLLMVKTLIRPDVNRPDSKVGVLLLDKRKIRLHIVGGTESPGWEYGVEGPGKIMESDLPNLMVAWKGGFLGSDGDYGMYADGQLYRPLVDGLASVAVTKDGEILMGEWGRSINWREDMAAVRQNAVLLVDDCEVTPLAIEQESNTRLFGRVWANSKEFITWRSAIGLTKNGDLIAAAGNDLSPATLARALQAAGACKAMQLDINNPQVLISLFSRQPNGVLEATKLMNDMTESNPKRFITDIQKHDFMYVTLDEKNTR